MDKLNYYQTFELGSGLTMPFWDFMGSVVVTSNYVRLTPDLQSKFGALWNSVVSNEINISFHKKF